MNMLRSAQIAALLIPIGTSVALAGTPQSRMVQPDYNFAPALSPDALRLGREVARLQELLRTHDATVDTPETIESPVSHAHVSRAVAAAATAPAVSLNNDDFAVVRATRTRFPRYLDTDDEE